MRSREAEAAEVIGEITGLLDDLDAAVRSLSVVLNSKAHVGNQTIKGAET